ncbi:hypothetical protein JC795_01815 [Pseudomonas veronii]|uniref:phage tail assembly chaperone n=1 Tax=Pseudomonas veronii TaxID=76761 RepID=UPI0018E8DABA|nr:phage tail assembly chaperone [Pseudomonas veronii]MBJ2176923.1 hypothetical protein [Pseudomonas veronii]
MWALVEDGVVLETTNVDPTERFHPDLSWVACPADVKPDWLVSDGEFVPPAVNESEQAELERMWRNTELQSTEWLMTRHRDEQDLERSPTLTSEQFSELLVYRQALRDWPQAGTFPTVEFRPVAPSWIAEQIQ